MQLYPAQNILCEVEDPAESGSWYALKAAQLQEYEINHRPVVSKVVSAQPWRQMVDGVGERSIRLSLRSYRSDGEAEGITTGAAVSRSHVNCRFTLGDNTQLSGPFMVQRMQWGGASDDLEYFNVRFESAGVISVG